MIILLAVGFSSKDHLQHNRAEASIKLLVLHNLLDILSLGVLLLVEMMRCDVHRLKGYQERKSNHLITSLVLTPHTMKENQSAKLQEEEDKRDPNVEHFCNTLVPSGDGCLEVTKLKRPSNSKKILIAEKE